MEGAEPTVSGDYSFGSGGGGGGWAELHVPSITGTYNITIGAGGVGGSITPINGTDGGDTSITGSAVSVTATGGKGGLLGLSNTGYYGTGGVLGGDGSGGDVSGKGQPSTQNGVAGGFLSGYSGGSKMGGGIRCWLASVAFAPDLNATVYGEGGGGANSVSGAVATEDAGDGFAGAVIITEYLK